MANILNLATTGLLALQQSIATTGQNITNVNTPGYSRQTVELSTRSTSPFGNDYIGNGVQVGSITRHANDLVNLQLRNSIAVNNELNQYSAHASSVDALLSDPATSVAASLSDFFSALHTVVESPNYVPARQTFLSQTELLVNRFHTVNQTLKDELATINVEQQKIVEQINSLATNIANINTRVVGSGSAPELLDKRDQLLNDLSELVAVSVIEQSDGAINVNIGNGQALVIAGIATPLTTITNPEDPRSTDIAIVANGSTVTITSQINGGMLGGILTYHDQVVAPVQRSIDKIALGLMASVNVQHQLGMDANNSLGATFFNDINSITAQQGRALSHSANTGSAVLNVSVDTLSDITGSDYRLTVATGPSYTLTRTSDNSTTTFASFPQTVDGFTLSLASGATASGDSFIISPTRDSASTMKMNVTTTNGLALAAPIRTGQSLSNIGAGSISVGTIVDTSNAAFTTTPGQLSPPLRIEFLSATSYQVVNATTSGVIEGPITYNPAQSNAIFPTPGSYDPGFRIDINGAPVTGDSFTIDYNSGGVGDSRNASFLTDIQKKKIFDGNTASLNDAYASTISDLGSKAHAAKINLEASDVLLQQAQAKRESFSGVNLDEEAANLLRFEQAYQASAQLISVASELFNTIIRMMGR